MKEKDKRFDLSLALLGALTALTAEWGDDATILKYRKGESILGEYMKASPLVVLFVVLVVVLIVVSVFLYFPGQGTDGLQTPAGAFGNAEVLNNVTGIVEFGPIAWDTKPSEIRIVIESFTWSAEYDMPADDQPGPLLLDGTLGASYSGNITSVAYFDRAQNGIVNAGDYIAITLAREAGESEAFIVTMIYVSSGAPIASRLLFW